jgi:hypothetical protein
LTLANHTDRSSAKCARQQRLVSRGVWQSSKLAIASFEHHSSRCCRARWRHGAWRARATHYQLSDTVTYARPCWVICVDRATSAICLLRNRSSLVARGTDYANARTTQFPSPRTERDLRHDASVDRDTIRVDDRCRDFSSLMMITLSRLMRYLMHLERKEAPYLQAASSLCTVLHCNLSGNSGPPR